MHAVAAETVSMQIPGLTYFLPLTLPDVSMPTKVPLLCYPARDLISRGVFASPFLVDSDDFSSLALICIVDAPLVIYKEDLAAIVMPVALEFDPLAYEDMEPIVPPNPSLNNYRKHFLDHQLLAFTSTIHSDKPFVTFVLNNRSFSGIIDTGADISVIRTSEWPADWPTTSSPAVRGVGGIQTARISTLPLLVTSSHTDKQALHLCRQRNATLPRQSHRQSKICALQCIIASCLILLGKVRLISSPGGEATQQSNCLIEYCGCQGSK
ncbi:uncharacterized protein LOC120297047 isoform X1 [Crotalus tigris]|uniref:uncharacterized protein LOC120297047 isoform X1 n=1 Tax=Crotalus tigris TaxID=88082 RepID=UPI00192F70AE|nr:uncharacterized protein LOC120297047 isoform X1 [Crotalus tigris]